MIPCVPLLPSYSKSVDDPLDVYGGNTLTCRRCFYAFVILWIYWISLFERLKISFFLHADGSDE